LLIEVPGQQQHRILELALAVAQRALAEFADHHDGAGEDRRNQEAAAKHEPQHRPAQGRYTGTSGRGHTAHPTL
jgi:hypothetical protein